MIITITPESEFVSHGSVVVVTGLNEQGQTVTFGAEPRAAADLAQAVQFEDEIEAEVEGWQILATIPAPVDGQDQVEATERVLHPYQVLRFYFSDEHDTEVIATGLTRAEAVAHCNDPETSSSTATSPEAVARTEQHGPWFDGFEEES